MSVVEQSKTGVAEEEREQVWERRVGRLKRRAWTRRLVNAFIVWHCFAVAMWLLPGYWPVVRDMLPPDNSGAVRAYMTMTDLMQSWQMFAPNPDNNDLYMQAEITYADGHKKVWTFPRLTDMGYGERYRRERFRKLVEVAERDNRVWPTMARYAARRNYLDPRDPPVAVRLLDHFRKVPPPGQPIPPYKMDVIFEAPITPGDLR